LLTRSVLAKGQVVLPKTIRDMLDISVGDELDITVEGDTIKMKKIGSPVDVFYEVSAKHGRTISPKEIKDILARRYG